MYLILVYDVEQKRVNRIHKFLKRYLNWIQNSVFEGEVIESDFENMKSEIKKLIKTEDSVIIFRVENSKWLQKEILGKERSEVSRII